MNSIIRTNIPLIISILLFPSTIFAHGQDAILPAITIVFSVVNFGVFSLATGNLWGVRPLKIIFLDFLLFFVLQFLGILLHFWIVRNSESGIGFGIFGTWLFMLVATSLVFRRRYRKNRINSNADQ